MLFQDMKGAASRYDRCYFEIWEVLNLLVRGGVITVLITARAILLNLFTVQYVLSNLFCRLFYQILSAVCSLDSILLSAQYIFPAICAIQTVLLSVLSQVIQTLPALFVTCDGIRSKGNLTERMAGQI